MLAAILASIVLASSAAAFADCPEERASVDAWATENQAANRAAWDAAGDALYARYREKITAELEALHARTAARLAAARDEGERGPIRGAHHAEASRIRAQWSDYHREKSDLDRRHRERHFEIRADWREAVRLLRDSEDCLRGARAGKPSWLRRLFEGTADLIRKDDPPEPAPSGSGGGIRG